ncbi:MAG: ankyrin repeat domain-containing protein [Treponema sp.]|nr:ankyrin repeat domain-containing protein [Candidatus Treponema caballi]
MKKVIASILATCCLCLILAGCASKETPEAENQTTETAEPVVQAEPVETEETSNIQDLILDGKSDDARALFTTKIDVNSVDENGNTALHAAARVNDYDLITFLIYNGAQTELKNYDGDTALHIAIKNKAVRSAEILSSYNGNIFAKDGNGMTALEMGLAAGPSFMDMMINEKTGELVDAMGRSIVHYFVEWQNNEAIDNCIRKHISLSVVDNYGNTPLSMCYAHADDIEYIRLAAKLIEGGASPLRGSFDYFEDSVKTRNPTLRFDDGQTPLHMAVIEGQSGIVEYLIEKGAQINAKDISGATPLHEAVRYGRTDIASTLLAAGGNANAQDSLGKTPLLIITPQDAQLETYQLLLKYGGNPNAKDLYGDTPLHIATMTGVSTEILSCLYLSGADIDERNKAGVTPLSMAVENHRADHIDFYTTRKADINAEDMDGNTPLTRALDSPLEMLQKLVNSTNVQTRDSFGNTPLHIAVQRGASVDQIRYLLTNGADVNARNRNGDTPLFIAIQKNDRASGELLLSYQADVFATNTDNYSPLRMALTAGGEIQDWVLSSEIIKATDGIGNTPLHYAAEWKLDSAIISLLEKGAYVNIQNANGETPLFNAVKSNSPSSIAMLMKNGADWNIRDFLGNTALHASVRYDAREAAKTLIDYGVDINAQNISGKTTLHEAAKSGRTAMVNLLLDNGADINAVDITGKTVLIDSIQGNNAPLVTLLLSRGASPHVQEMYGRNAYHEAAARGNIEIIEALRAVGGNPLSRDSYGNTPFSLSLDFNNDVVHAVIGDDATLADSDGNTPIHLAVKAHVTAERLSVLLSLSYPINRRNSQGQTPLILAISGHQYEAARVLLENGADPFLNDNLGNSAASIAVADNAEVLTAIVQAAVVKADVTGDTLLHYAAKTGTADTIKRLLSMGLSQDTRNISGETAYDIAKRWDRGDEILTLLK